MTYNGDLTPLQAYELLLQEPQAVLIDVRTRAEWTHVGVPDLSGISKAVVFIEWNRFPDGSRNETFLDELSEAVPDKETPLAFICRSGQRSRHAAQAAVGAGYATAFNVADGFEGKVDDMGHRGTVAGWKVTGLPWRQT